MKSEVYFVIFLSILSVFCQQKEEVSQDLRCDSLNKIDSLIQDVLLKPYLYSSGPGESRIDFIVENEVITKEKSFKNEFHEEIKVIDKEIFDSSIGRIIRFDSIEVTNSNSAKVKVRYFSPLDEHNQRRLRNTIVLKYLFNSKNCKWLLTDSTILVH